MREAKKTPAKGYAGHKEGSRKATVHEVFDNQGPEAAFTRGMKLKLSENTHSWIATWRRAATPMRKKPTTKTAAPKVARAATPPPQPETTSVVLQG